MKKSICVLAVALLLVLSLPVFSAYAFSGEQIAETTTESGLKTPPIVVSDVTTAEELQRLTGEEKPVQAIFTLDGNGNVVGKSGEKLCDLTSAVDTAKKGVLPVFKIKKGFADGFIALYEEKIAIDDVSVMSDDAETVKKVKEKYPAVRGITEFDENADITKIPSAMNENLSLICVFPEELATTENVSYVQARFKTVWVKAESNEKISLKNCVNSGCFGVVTENFVSANETLKEYSEGVSRTPFNVAHRGLPNAYNENSVSGTKVSIEAGATHVELDCYLTTGDEIVFMHDANLARTSTGTGNIEDYSSEQLSRMRLKQFADEEIPFFEDVAETLKDSGVILVLEIKSQKENIVNVLKEKLDKEFGWFKNYLTVISFHQEQLEKMKEILPEIPTANLSGASSDDLTKILTVCGEYNCAVDYNMGAIDKTKRTALIDRGFIPWTWTYGGEPTIVNGLETGIPAMTNNDADALTNLPRYIEINPVQSKKPIVGEEIDLTVKEYSGEQKSVKGIVTDVKETGKGKYEVVATYNPEEYYLATVFYTQKKTVTVKKRGCSSAVSGFAVVLPVLATFAIISHGKRKDENE